MQGWHRGLRIYTYIISGSPEVKAVKTYLASIILCPFLSPLLYRLLYVLVLLATLTS